MRKKRKVKVIKKRVKKSALPILPLSEAIKRLGDDEVWKKVSKGFRWED